MVDDRRLAVLAMGLACGSLSLVIFGSSQAIAFGSTGSSTSRIGLVVVNASTGSGLIGLALLVIATAVLGAASRDGGGHDLPGLRRSGYVLMISAVIVAVVALLTAAQVAFWIGIFADGEKASSGELTVSRVVVTFDQLAAATIAAYSGWCAWQLIRPTSSARNPT